jgi:hypothetical protein
MFRGHEGFIGAVFGQAHDERVVITRWGRAPSFLRVVRSSVAEDRERWAAT